VYPEMNTSGRLLSELGIGLKDSIVLYVDAPLLLLEATVFSAAAGLYVPEPVGLSTWGSGRCKVIVRSIKPLLDDSLPAIAREALFLLHERILSAIQAVGQREPALENAHSWERAPA
jgi:hypothetical protein